MDNPVFVIQGNNEAETPILLFTSVDMAQAYIDQNPGRKYAVYVGHPPKQNGE